MKSFTDMTIRPSQVHNPLQMLVLTRIKYQLGYPESAKDMVKPKSLFTGALFIVLCPTCVCLPVVYLHALTTHHFFAAVEQYSMGSSRKLEDYLKIVGLNMNTKEVMYTAWCETGIPPPGFEKHSRLYEVS